MTPGISRTFAKLSICSSATSWLSVPSRSRNTMRLGFMLSHTVEQRVVLRASADGNAQRARQQRMCAQIAHDEAAGDAPVHECHCIGAVDHQKVGIARPD